VGLFQKQPIRQEIVLPYRLDTQESDRILIVGLGNPGKKYESTRHNLGFMVADKLADQNQSPTFNLNKDFKSEISEAMLGSNKVIIAKPQTFMNESGQAVKAITSFYKIPSKNIVVVYDELSIPYGQIRMRVGGQAAGHNGIKSIISHIGPDFGRVRIGIKNSLLDSLDASDFVLKPFTKDEKSQLPILVNEAALVLNEYIYGGQLPHDTRTIII
jgi:PTH1 family peptidyl-tRNA hydrolase